MEESSYCNISLYEPCYDNYGGCFYRDYYTRLWSIESNYTFCNDMYEYYFDSTKSTNGTTTTTRTSTTTICDDYFTLTSGRSSCGNFISSDTRISVSWLSRITASLSIIGSSLIIYHIIKYIYYGKRHHRHRHHNNKNKWKRLCKSLFCCGCFTCCYNNDTTIKRNETNNKKRKRNAICLFRRSSSKKNTTTTVITTETNLVFLMSISDLIVSIMFVLGPIMIPSEYYPATTSFAATTNGNQWTCTLQGSLMNCFHTLSTWCSVMLAIYFVLLLRQNWPESKFHTWPIKFIAYVFPVITFVILGLMLNFLGVIKIKPGDHHCIPNSSNGTFWSITIVLLAIELCIVFISMILLWRVAVVSSSSSSESTSSRTSLRHQQRTEQQQEEETTKVQGGGGGGGNINHNNDDEYLNQADNARYNNNNNNSQKQQSSSSIKKVAIIGSLYSMAFLITWIWLFLSYGYSISSGYSLSSARSEIKTPIWLAYCFAIFIPLQGFWNCILYFYRHEINVFVIVFRYFEKKWWIARIEKRKGYTLKDAPIHLLEDPDIIQTALVNNPSRETTITAIQKSKVALKFAPDKMKHDKLVVLFAVKHFGCSLQYATDQLRMDHEVVLKAVRQNPTALKFALGGLNQSHEFLKVSGLFDNISEYKPGRNKIVLSTRFSLDEKSTATATIFALLMKRNIYLGNKNIYSPNCWNKGTCDPNWTDYDHPCNGTYETCGKEHAMKTGMPQEEISCWKYSFRFQLERPETIAMVQVVEYYYVGEILPNYNGSPKHIAGNGQRIETRMAKNVGLKVFRCFQPVDNNGERHEFDASMIDDVADAIKNWMEEDNQATNLEVQNIHWTRNLGRWWVRDGSLLHDEDDVPNNALVGV